jgi:quercetin dioxygenase-like cupin family protein
MRLVVGLGLVLSTVALADAPKPAKPMPVVKVPPLPPQINDTLFADTEAAKWVPITGLPKGALGALIGTEPAEGGMAGWLKFPAGYHVPAQWETHLTNYTVVKGTLTITDNGIKHVLTPGGFALVGSKDKHELTCGAEECLIVVRHFGPPDMHWVTPPKK